MDFEILVSTMHKNTHEVLKMIKENNIKWKTLVVVQGSFDDYQEINKEDQVIRIFFSNERGLSKSRNLALKNCTAKYGYIMDDDVVLKDDAINKIVHEMEKDSADIGTAQFEYDDGRNSMPGFNSAFVHNFLTAAKVASIEICVRMASIREKNIAFDEKFGLGTELPSGEEYIFITDCLKKGLTVKYYPVCIGIHPTLVSGNDFYTSENKILAKREMLKRVFKLKSPLYIFAFWLKKMPYVLKKGYACKFTKIMFFG